MLGLRHLERKGYAGWTVKWESSSHIQIFVILVKHSTISTNVIVCFSFSPFLPFWSSAFFLTFGCLVTTWGRIKNGRKKQQKQFVLFHHSNKAIFSMLKSPSHVLYVKNWWSPPHVYLSSFVSIHVDVGVMVNIERHLQLRDSCLLHGNRIAKKSLADSLHIKKGSSCPRLFLFRIFQCGQYMTIWSCFHFLSITVSKDMVCMGWGTVANWLLFWSDTPLPDCQEHCWKISRLTSCLSSPPGCYKCKQKPIL